MMEVKPSKLLDVLLEASKLYGERADVILSRRRQQNAVDARHYVMRQLKEAGHSYMAIGRAMGCHHTTVLYALRD